MNKFMKKNSSIILSVIGAAGVVGTAVLAVKATPKAIQIIQEKETECERELTKTEKVKVSWKVYVPTVVVGVSTIACIFGVHGLSKRNQASLISAYTLLDRTFKEYQNKVNDIYGEDANDQIMKAIASDKYSKLNLKVSEDKQLFYDMTSQRYFESTLADVYKAEYEINRLYSEHGYATLNEFYDLLQIDRIEEGSDLGWSVEASHMFYGYSSIEFKHEVFIIEDDTDNPLECCALIMTSKPSADYLF